MNEGKNILLAEDDANLGFVIKDGLSSKGFNVILTKDGENAISTFEKGSFHICVFDVMMPKTDGFELAKQVRKIDPHIPIIFLTAKSLLEDKLKGFEIGGDDYITKPFSMEELVYRIDVFLKRSNQPSSIVDVHQIGLYTFDYKNLKLTFNTSATKLTQKEADVLLLFCQHKGEILKREFILTEIWGTDDYFLGRSMDVFISKLRKRFKGDPSLKITNYHGVGFKLELLK